jgi:hypothetical protein
MGVAMIDVLERWIALPEEARRSIDVIPINIGGDDPWPTGSVDALAAAECLDDLAEAASAGELLTRDAVREALREAEEKRLPLICQYPDGVNASLKLIRDLREALGLTEEEKTGG